VLTYAVWSSTKDGFSVYVTLSRTVRLSVSIISSSVSSVKINNRHVRNYCRHSLMHFANIMKILESYSFYTEICFTVRMQIRNQLRDFWVCPYCILSSQYTILPDKMLKPSRPRVCMYVSFGQGSSLLWTHTLRPFRPRVIAYKYAITAYHNSSQAVPTPVLPKEWCSKLGIWQ